MTNLSSYQPFVIGKFQSGQQSYYKSWQNPADAFEPMVNSYAYRGELFKRQGYQPCGFTGLLRYQNCETVATGTGAANNFTGTVSRKPVEPSSVMVKATVGGNILTATDNGLGAITGALIGAASTIDYNTGAYNITTTGNVDNGFPLQICYKFNNSNTAELIGTGDGVTLTFNGTLTNIPLVPLSISIATTTLAGATTITANEQGVLSGSFVAAGSSINYTTGVWNLIFTSAPTATATGLIYATYAPTAITFGSPIMGINHYANQLAGAEIMTVQDQKRMFKFNTVTKLFDPITTFSDIIYTETNAGATGTIPGAINLPWTNIAPYSVSVSYNGATITDDGIGGFTTSGNLNSVGNSSIVYATGVITITYAAAAIASANVVVTGTLAGNYFNSGNDNFFKWENWKANDISKAYLYVTNNVDRITLFDGTNLLRPAFPIYEAQIVPKYNGINTCLDIKVYKNRLLFIRPNINTYATGGPFTPAGITGTITEAQVVRYSSEFYQFEVTNIDFDFVADVAGHGGVADAPTPDWIIAAEYLRDAIVFFFQKSTWLFRFTGSAFSPYRWDQINASRTSNAPYSSLNYDDYVTSVGTKGHIACDGVNVERYDTAIVDDYQDIDNDNFEQCNSIRDDIANQSWLIYPSVSRPDSNLFSDQAVIYNFLEKNFARYQIDLTTLGINNTYQDITWASFAPGSGVWTAGKTWQECNFTWTKFNAQNLSPVVYGGNQYGYVYMLNVTETDAGKHINCELASKRWNPFLETTGERIRVAYIDVYYEINDDIILQIDMRFNTSSGPTLTKYMAMAGNEALQSYAWKRIFVNMTGQFIQLTISTPYFAENPILKDGTPFPNDGTFKISGIIVWGKPAGRLTPGVFP